MGGCFVCLPNFVPLFVPPDFVLLSSTRCARMPSRRLSSSTARTELGSRSATRFRTKRAGVVEEFVERGERLRGVPELHRVRELDLPSGRGKLLRRKYFGHCPEKCGAKGGIQVERGRFDVQYELLQKLANRMHFCMRGRADENKSLPRGK